MKLKKIIFRADGYKELGLGHIYNCVTMAKKLNFHDVVIVVQADSDIGIEKLKEEKVPFHVVKNELDLFEYIDFVTPDIYVNDCLNTTVEQVKKLKEHVPRVITIEDLGEGGKFADAVVNAMYENETSGNVYSGHKYVFLRDEFKQEEPNSWNDEVNNILVMFGGTDPANLNVMLYSIAKRLTRKHKSVSFSFLTGIGYDCESNGVVDDVKNRIHVYSNVHRVTEYMKKSEIAVTSQGRTIFELAAMRIPSIVLSQNEREATHGFAQLQNGFLNLGMGAIVDSKLVENTLDWLINATVIRKDMYRLMSELDLKNGIERVVSIILGEKYYGKDD